MNTPRLVAQNAKRLLTPETMKPHPTPSRALPQPLPMKRATKVAKALAAIGMAMFLAGAVHAATVFFSPTNMPPVSPLGSIFISNLFNAYISPAHGSDFGAGSNVGSGGNGGGSGG